MKVMDAIMTRRSVRAFDKDCKVENEKIEKLIRAGMNAPSALGQHAWRFLTITKREKLDSIAKLNDWWNMMTEATLGIGILINLEEANGLDEEFLVISASLAAENILLAAHAMGVEGVYLGISKKEEYYSKMKSMFNIPESLRMIGVLAMGYSKEDSEIPLDRFEEEKWIREQF